MRIYFHEMTLPKKAAKRIQKHYSDKPEFLDGPHLLSESQLIAARMLGYSDWHELEQVTKSRACAASPLDEDSPAEIQKARLNYQVDVLASMVPLTRPALTRLALKFRVSAGNPHSRNFDFDSYRRNTLFLDEPYGQEPGWRYRPSQRSNEIRDELYELSESYWQSKSIARREYIESLLGVINRQPENLVAFQYLFELFESIGDWEQCVAYLEDFESAVNDTIPAQYPRTKKVPPLNWYIIENRDYLRALNYLATGFYANGDFKKAKTWFLLLTRCSDREIEHEKFFLHDLRQKIPAGDIHELQTKDLWGRYMCLETGRWLHKL